MDKAELRACLEQADAKEAGALLRAALRNKMREALMEIYEEEVQGLCGPSHSRDSKSDYYRAGSSPAKVKLGEHEHTIRRSRVRKSLGDASAEKHLATWKAVSNLGTGLKESNSRVVVDCLRVHRFNEAQFIRNSGGGGDSYESPYYGSPYQVGGSNDY